MHASIWQFRGDPDALTSAYESMIAEIPAENMRLHLCLRTDDGLLMIDTCPSQEVFAAFAGSEAFRALREACGLPEPDSLEDHPVYAAFAGGQRVS